MTDNPIDKQWSNNKTTKINIREEYKDYAKQSGNDDNRISNLLQC